MHIFRGMSDSANRQFEKYSVKKHRGFLATEL